MRSFHHSRPAHLPHGNKAPGDAQFWGAPGPGAATTPSWSSPSPSPSKEAPRRSQVKLSIYWNLLQKTQHCARVQGVFLVSQFLLDLKSWCSRHSAQGEGRGHGTSVVAIYSGNGLAPRPGEAAETLERGEGAAAKSPSRLLRAGVVEAA